MKYTEEQIQEMAKAAYPTTSNESTLFNELSIAKQEAYIKGFTACQEQNPWRMVEDGLPQCLSGFSERVLCFYETGLVQTAFYDFEMNRWSGLNLPKVTHWKYLDAPPVNKEG